ncbi:MAG: DUF6029 family protein [Bacteroidia bacterium]|nr:DUF6029 family protein [Bacteroidia bacterium]
MQRIIKKICLTIFLLLRILSTTWAQDNPINLGSLSGNFQLDGQYYFKDTLIGAPDVPEKFLSNGFLNLQYQREAISAGIRYENYLNPLLGFDRRFTGQGIPFRFISYTKDKLSVTVGNFYEQFGTGMTLRTYYEPALGFDNVLDGVKASITPIRGIYLKGLIGKQRSFWEKGVGIIRGGDCEIILNELSDSFLVNGPRIMLGGSFVSRFQPGKTLTTPNFEYKLPENVAIYSARARIQWGKFMFEGEYARKSDDPGTLANRYDLPGATDPILIYRKGEALYLMAAYSKKGLGISLAAKRLDNIDFRSDRNAIGNNLNVNFLPPLAKQHTYRLPTLYLYATQPNGEMAIKGDVVYTIKKGTVLGGPYGTTIQLSYANVHSLDTTRFLDERGYESGFWKVGKKLYYSDLNIEITRKWSSLFKSTLSYLNINYDKDQILGLTGFGLVKTHIGIADLTFNINDKHAIRTEFQIMETKQDFGSWGMFLVEYTIAPKFFIAFFDEYNYGNKNPEKRIHYFSGNFGINLPTTRIQVGYGRQREGIVCVGGVCRQMPASNGFFLSITSSF